MDRSALLCASFTAAKRLVLGFGVGVLLAACGEDGTGPDPVAEIVPGVSAGGSHTCGLTPSGAAYCWGSNGVGELGTPAATESCRGAPCSTRPLAVSGGLTFASLSAGQSYSCGLTPGGGAYCWGDNRHGKLGNGSTTSSNVPIPVSGGLTFAFLRAGTDHTCGVTRTGQAYCWGVNRFGELGNRSTTETCPNVFGDPVPCSTRPVPVSGGLTFASAHPARLHTCGVTPAGSAYCWGYNGAGLLGTIEVTESCGGVDRDFTCSPTPVPVSGGLTFASLSAGNTHTCGVVRDGQAYCWGVNSWGVLGRSLGQGGPISTPTPGAVSGGLTFSAVTAGYQHSCGIAAGGAAHCWGFGFSGALGDGSRAVGGSLPAAVVGGLTFASVSAGNFHTCGMTTGGRIYCWGVNSAGQLGSTAASETCVTDRGGAQHACSTTPLPVLFDASQARAFPSRGRQTPRAILVPSELESGARPGALS